MNIKELKNAYKNDTFKDIVNIVYDFLTNAMDAKATKFLRKKNIIEEYNREILSHLKYDETSGLTSVESCDYCSNVWENFVINPKMQMILNVNAEIKKAYEEKLERTNKIKEILINKLETRRDPFNEDPYYDHRKRFFKLPAYLFDKAMVKAVIKYFDKSNTGLISAIKNKNPDLLKDVEIVAELIIVFDPLGKGECFDLKDVVTNEIYDEALKLAEPQMAQNASDKAKKESEEKAAEEKAKQEQEDKRLKEKHDNKIKSLVKEIAHYPDYKYLSANTCDVIGYLKRSPLEVKYFIISGCKTYETFEEVVAQIPNANLANAEKLNALRAYEIYTVVEAFRIGNIKFKDIPAEYFAFDDVVKEVCKIAEKRIKEEAEKLTKDIKMDGEVPAKVKSKIEKQVANIQLQIADKREECKRNETETIESLDKIDV